MIAEDTLWSGLSGIVIGIVLFILIVAAIGYFKRGNR